MNKVEKAIEKEQIIKSKIRVQKHGEVFTPKKIVNQMLDLDEVNKACNELESTFLEPAAGEGAFLKEIITRKLQMIEKNYKDSLIMYENYSLLALSTIYGIELLEDNAQACSLNIFQIYYEFYNKVASNFNEALKKKVLDSAKLIISANIAQGDFLTQQSPNGKEMIFSEWKIIQKNKNKIKIVRTEYTLDEISKGVQKDDGEMVSGLKNDNEQINIFELLEPKEETQAEISEFRFTVVNITDVYKEEMEIYDG